MLGLVAAALMPKQMRAVQRKLAQKTAASLGWGALTFFVIAPAVLVVLVISVVGLLLVVPYAVFLRAVLLLRDHVGGRARGRAAARAARSSVTT